MKNEGEEKDIISETEPSNIDDDYGGGGGDEGSDFDDNEYDELVSRPTTESIRERVRY